MSNHISTDLLDNNICWRCNVEMHDNTKECLWLKYQDIINEEVRKDPINPYNKELHEYYPCYLWCASQKRKQWNERMEKYRNPSLKEIRKMCK